MLVSQNNLKILLFERNKHLSKALYHFLSSQGYDVYKESNPTTTLRKIYSNEYRLLIIDCHLGRREDSDFITQIRHHNLAILILIIGPKSLELEISAYMMGINNYHSKPIRFNLLCAQVNQLTYFFRKRITLELEDIRIDISKRIFLVHNNKIDLTYNEFCLVLFLIKAEGCILSRDLLIQHLFNCNKNISPAAVDTMISRIRKKTKEYIKNPFIDTVYKCGYRINPTLFNKCKTDSSNP